MKEITAIIGSPRKKNTLRLVEAVEEAICKKEKVEFRYFHLADMRIEPCKGCMLCITKGFEHCPIDDDVKSINEALISSDGIILASPVFVMHITSQMKTLIDRLCYLCHRPALCHSQAMALSTTGAIGLKKALSYLTGVLEMWGCRSTVSAGLATLPANGVHSAFSKAETGKIEAAAGKFLRNLDKGDRQPVKLTSLIQFRMQRMIFTSDRIREIMPADHDFYRKLIGKRYFTDARISIFKRFVAWIIQTVAKPFL